MTPSPENAALIHDSLEHIAQQIEDITPAVYSRFFERYPNAVELFGHDEGDMLKGEMLSKLLVQIMDFAEGRTDPDIIVSWASDHVAYGVDLAMFPAMFESLESVLREAAASRWTAAVSAAWQAQFGGLMTLIEAAYRRFGPGGEAWSHTG